MIQLQQEFTIIHVWLLCEVAFPKNKKNEILNIDGLKEDSFFFFDSRFFVFLINFLPQVLQNQLQLLQKLSKSEDSMYIAPGSSSAGKGKDTASSSSPVQDLGNHGDEIEETDT